VLLCDAMWCAVLASTCAVLCCAQAEGKLEEKLHEMYRWGKTHGWEPVVWVDGEPQPAASVVAAAAAASAATAVQY
jgi:hypothetical protein